jgi:hypothetical protein
MKTIHLLALALVLCSGCASKTIYSWGHYEDLIYTMYSKPSDAAPERQIEVLEADLQKALSQNKPLPPGFHAHLGYMYYQAGKTEQARKAFETEKTQFPESAVFMDRMLANLKTP